MASWYESNRGGSPLRWGIATLCVGAAFLLGGLTTAHTTVTTGPAHKCHAPCAVTLPDGTLEDEFGIDYGWSGHTPIVDVYKARPDYRDQERKHFCKAHTHTLPAYMECLRNV
jgi:hypothetical protein